MSKFASLIMKLFEDGEANNCQFIDLLNTKLNDMTTYMMKHVTKMPKLSSFAYIMPIYDYIKYFSISASACIVGYKGLKMLFSEDELSHKEGKNIFGRLIYSFMFSSLSIRYIDFLITANNVLSKSLIDKFSISAVACTSSNGILIPVIFFVGETLMIIKILIGFWMRMAELVFAGVISPAMFTLWINNEWQGYMSGWVKRVSSLVFAQLSLVLVLIIYTMIMRGQMNVDSVNSACLSVATLFLLDKSPKILQGFGDNSEYDSAKKTINKMIKSQTKLFTKMKALKVKQ